MISDIIMVLTSLILVGAACIIAFNIIQKLFSRSEEMDDAEFDDPDDPAESGPGSGDS